MPYNLDKMHYRPRTVEEATERYGPIVVSPKGDLKWSEADKWLTPFILPEDALKVLKLSDGKPVTKIFVNKDCLKPLAEVFENLSFTGALQELVSFDGCFNVRWVRGHPGQVSLHSYALALDFNAFRNPLGALRGSWSDIFVGCWKDVGWVYGGDFTRHDPMHFQWCG